MIDAGRIEELRGLLAKAEAAATRMAQNRSSLTDLMTIRSIVNATPDLLDLASRAVAPSLAGGEAEELCARLEATRDGIPFGWASSDGRSDIQTPKHLINPDGPEATAMIRSLTAAKDKAEREENQWRRLCASSEDYERAQARIAALEKALGEAREALRPFVSHCEPWMERQADGDHPLVKDQLDAANAIDRLAYQAQGYCKDAKHAESVADELRRLLEKEKERADKFMWQVRDTCARAEAAEARADKAERERDNARDQLERAEVQEMGWARELEAAEARAAELEKALGEARVENARLDALINSPHVDEWFDGVRIEAAHQIERWGSDHDAGKMPLDWFWLIGYLAQKAVHAAMAGDDFKAKHHTISTGAALLNWFRRMTGDSSVMRPGLSGDAQAQIDGRARALVEGKTNG